MNSSNNELVYSRDIDNATANEERENFESIKDTMLLFLQEFIVVPNDNNKDINFKNIVEKISLSSNNNPDNIIFDFRVGIDPVGNTSLHWLSKLSLVEVIKDIFENKSSKILASDNIVNNNSESCLVECIKSINSFNSDNFEQMLILFDHIVLSNDLIYNRNILQYICLNYNENASEYYLKKVIDHVSKKYSSDTFNKFINNKDIEGDTCLNIASKLNLYSLIQTLLENGADPLIANAKYIKPSDYGITETNNNSISDKKIGSNLITPISLINETTAEINETYMKETASYTAELKNLDTEIEVKKQELSKLKSQVSKINLEDYDSLKQFTFLNNGLLKQRELLDKQLDTFPEFKQFIDTFGQNEGKLPMPLVSEELLSAITAEDLNNNEHDGNNSFDNVISTSDANTILSKLSNNLKTELDSISLDQLDTLIDTYKQQNESMEKLFEELGNHKRRRVVKYRTLIAKTLDMDVEDTEAIDLVVEGMCNEI